MLPSIIEFFIKCLSPTHNSHSLKESPIFILNKELFMLSENTKAFTAEYNDHSLWLISEIQFGTISLIENHINTRGIILPLLSFRLTTTKMIFIYCSTGVFYILLLDAPIHKTPLRLWNPETYTHIPIIAIIFSQNHEFSKSCLPPNYLAHSAFR